MGEITRVVFFGDSHTVGYGTKDRVTWADHLKGNFYNDRDGLEKIFFYNISKEGMTTTSALEIAKGSLDFFLTEPGNSNPRERSLSIVALGVNEASVRHDGRPAVSPLAFRQSLWSLTRFLVQRSKVLYVDFPPVCEIKMEQARGYSIRPQQETHQEYREVIHQYAEEAGAHSVRLPPMDSASITVDDGVHLNKTGHEMVYQHVLPTFQSIVRSPHLINRQGWSLADTE